MSGAWNSLCVTKIILKCYLHLLFSSTFSAFSLRKKKKGANCIVSWLVNRLQYLYLSACHIQLQYGVFLGPGLSSLFDLHSLGQITACHQGHHVDTEQSIGQCWFTKPHHRPMGCWPPIHSFKNTESAPTHHGGNMMMMIHALEENWL